MKKLTWIAFFVISSLLGHGANNDLPIPSELDALGKLTRDLVAYFSFASRTNGGLAWSCSPLQGSFSTPVRLKVEGGQNSACFTEPGAVLTFDTPLRLGKSFTLAAWAWLGEHPRVLWQGRDGNTFLYIVENEFRCWKPIDWGGTAPPQYLYFKSPRKLTGWHHFAVTGDQRQTALYVDGLKRGVVKIGISDALTNIGNQDNPGLQQGWQFSGRVDSQLIFRRKLTDEEIPLLLSVGAP